MDAFHVGLNTCFWASVYLTNRQILNLAEIDSILYHHRMPVRKVQICGWIVGIVEKTNRIIMDIDDGTGVVTCIQWQNGDQSLKVLDLGEIVSVSGRLTQYQGELQLDAYIVSIETVEYEQFFKLKVIEMNRIYRLPTDTTCLDSRDLSQFNRTFEVAETLDAVELEISKLLLVEYVKPTEFDTVCNSELLQNKFEQLTNIRATDPSYRTMIAKLTLKLLNDGKIFEHPQESNIYTKTSASNLGAEICKVLRSEAINGGLYFDELMVVLKREQRFAKVGKQIVQEMLSIQSELGRVSEILPRKYISR